MRIKDRLVVASPKKLSQKSMKIRERGVLDEYDEMSPLDLPYLTGDLLHSQWCK
jgi:hypothetical protein